MRIRLRSKKTREGRQSMDEKVKATQRGHWTPKPGSLVADVEADAERAPKPIDADEPDAKQEIGSDLDGFMFPGHHRVAGGWDGPDD